MYRLKPVWYRAFVLLFLFAGCAYRRTISGQVPGVNPWFKKGKTNRYKVIDSVTSYVKVQKIRTSRITSLHMLFELKVDTVIKDTVFTHFRILNITIDKRHWENSSTLKGANIAVKLLIDGTVLKISIPSYYEDNYSSKIMDIIDLFFGFYPSKIGQNKGKWRRNYNEQGLTSDMQYRLLYNMPDSLAVIKSRGHIRVNRLKSINVSDIHLKFSGTVKGRALWSIEKSIPLKIDLSMQTKGIRRINSLMTGNIALPFRAVEHIIIKHITQSKTDF